MAGFIQNKNARKVSYLALHSLQPRAFFQYSQKRAKQVKLACKLPTHTSSFNYHHLDSLKVSIKPALAENFVIPKDAEDTDLEQYVASHVNYGVLGTKTFDILNFECISDPGVWTFITKLNEVVRDSSKKLGKNETLTYSLLNDLLRIVKLNTFPLIIRNTPICELFVGDHCVIAKPKFLIKSQDNVLVAVEDSHLNIVRPGNGFGEPQLAIEILSSEGENSRPYYDEKLGYYKDQTVFSIHVISTHVTFYKAVIPARYWNELENGYPENSQLKF
ncbi:23681_t:CDS:2 [Dentiscutata erythropus]|uniref:23681_t:CDS:1 n=1 Tax=Dentiscutata erythropus TaxID=1348616 RepID=A0A9N8VA23_9GLOM|nr:23681_t:CDS:2 [Dentiscutata erythropus]